MNPARCKTSYLRLYALFCCLVVPIIPASARGGGGAPLPVTDGLELRIDAREINTVRRERGLSILTDGSQLGVWHDSGPSGRVMTQRLDTSMPVYHESPGGGSTAFVRLDGRDDFLQWSGRSEPLRGATVVIVASPRGSAGGFPGLVSFNERERNDYTSGFNMDLGPGAAPQFSSLNIEGAGFGGAVNLLRQAHPLGTFHIVTAVVPDGPGEVELFVDGRPEGRRPRDARAMGFEELTLGARLYSNDAAPPHVAGFLNGDIASVMIYSRPLPESERRDVEAFLRERHAPLFRLRGLDDSLGERLSGDGPLQPLVFEPPGAPGGPPVQFLAPGFKARELPLELKNINNLLYRADGVLVALGYDGAIYLLHDTDGDGLEDRADIFWEKGKLRGPIGMALTPRDYAHGNGVFVASKGRVSLIVDTDGDERADEEKVIATGWKEITQAVDALGVALDKEGNVFFGLGTTDYTNAYLIDSATGKAYYSAAGERGTIQKLSPDFSRRETVCSGVRFSVAVKFNAAGDLFCTDQEGQTWLPGGNPLDELLHIQPGRHYGFPPRHPIHLPNVFDEPSAALYGPEHQSTCGLMFNEAAGGAPIFGPEQWRGDAFVAGYSRGRVFRTQLVKAEAGYISRSHTFACFGMLPVDMALAPDGSMIVACHSGDPDWGSGPEGMGKLFKITYEDREAPQPVAAWAEGPMEVRVAFDRPVERSALELLKDKVTITYGPYVRAGDSFEAYRPGYQLVQEQLAAPRFRLNVTGTSLADDGKTLVVSTQPHSMRAWHALRIPNLSPSAPPESRTIEMDYTLNGWQAEWKSDEEEWKGWLPDSNFTVASRLLAGSEQAGTLRRLIETSGKLLLRTEITRPPDAESFTLTGPGAGPDFEDAAHRRFPEYPILFPDPPPTLPVELRIITGSGEGSSFSWTAAGNHPNRRPLPFEAFVSPWAPIPVVQSDDSEAADAPKIEGGNWLRGQRLFFGEARCHQCHQLRGEGRAIGPDLTNLIYRDAGSVARDIRQPGAAINPDYVTYTVTLKSGEEFSSLLKSGEDGTIHAFDSNGEERTFSAGDVADYRASSVSTMPEGLADALDEEKFRDLLTFLLEPPPLMPADLGGAPPPRKKSEIEAALGHELNLGEAPEVKTPLRILLVAGAQDHGPGEHDYPAWQKTWEKLLAMAVGVEVTTAWEWPSDDDLARADVVVFYCWSHPWSLEKAPAMRAYLGRGGGLLFLHAATIVDRDFDAFREIIGLVAHMGPTGFRHGDLDLDFSRGENHPITRGIARTVHFHDESYWPLEGDESDVNILATGIEDGAPRPLIWTFEPGKGRVFCSILGHYSWTFDDPIFRLMVLRAMAWTARQPESRLEELATAGVALLRE